MQRMVLTLCKQNRSKTAETICILTTENCLWLLLEVGEANIQFTRFTRRCHCSQLPELENDTKMNAFIRRLLSEELNGIIFHKAKCLLTLGKRCWSCWKVTVTSGVYDGTAEEGPTGVSDTDKCVRDRRGCF